MEEPVEHLAHRGGLAHRAAVGADAVGRDDAHHLARLVRDDETRRDLGWGRLRDRVRARARDRVQIGARVGVRVRVRARVRVMG